MRSVLIGWFWLGAGALLPAESLSLLVLQGQDAIHNVRERDFVEPVVQVVDSGGKPVGGASVTFVAPAAGPGGSFAGVRYLTVTTAPNGEAVGRGFRPNSQPGAWELRVVGGLNGETARTVLRQTNAVPLESSPELRRSHKRLWAGIAAAGAVAIVSASLAGRPPRLESPTLPPPAPGAVVSVSGGSVAGRP